MVSLNPCLPCDYLPDGGSTYVKAPTNFSFILYNLWIKATNLSNFFISKLVMARLLSSIYIYHSSASIECILHILGSGSGGKMAGINARRVVARMHDVQSNRDLSEMDLVGKPMGSNSFMLSIDLNSKMSVASPINGSGPFPALRSLLNFAPKSVMDILGIHGPSPIMFGGSW